MFQISSRINTKRKGKNLKKLFVFKLRQVETARSQETKNDKQFLTINSAHVDKKMTGIALIYQVFTVVFISVGTFTNATSAYVYSRKLMRKTSYSTYLFSLAFVDMLVTLTGNIRLGLMFYNTGDLVDDAVNSNYPGFDIRELSIVSCRLHIFFTYYFLQLSSTIICLLNLDRVFGVLSSLRARKFCKPSIARRLVISAMLVLALVNVHLLIFMGDFDGQIEFIEMSSNNSELFYDDKVSEKIF